MSGSATTTQSSGLPSQFLPYITNYLDSASQVAQLPFQQYQGQRVADLSGLQQGALNSYAPLNSFASPIAANTANSLSGMTSGSMNPYMQQVEDQVTQDATRAYNNATSGITQRYNTTGNFGGVRNQMAQDLANQDLARGLAQGLAAPRAAAFENAQNRAITASGALNSLYNTANQGIGSQLQAGQIPQQYNQSLLDTNYNDWLRSIQYPQNQLDIYGNAIAHAMGGLGSSSTTTGPGSNPVSQGLGIAMLGNILPRSGK